MDMNSDNIFDVSTGVGRTHLHIPERFDQIAAEVFRKVIEDDPLKTLSMYLNPDIWAEVEAAMVAEAKRLKARRN